MTAGAWVLPLLGHNGGPALEEPTHRLSWSDFRDYQHFMTDRVYFDPYVFLAAEMGLGKTGAVLKAIVHLLDDGKIKGPVLVVAPKRVATDTWPDEVKVWAETSHLTVSVVVGEVEERKAAANAKADVYVVNRENVVWLYRHLGIRKWKFDMLVYDEASRLKNGSKKTKPTKRKDGSFSNPNLSEFGVLCRTRFAFKKVVELSGTPAPNGLQDLWGPFYIMDKGKRLGTSRTAFERRWFIEEQYTHKTYPTAAAHHEIPDLISDVMVSLKEEDYLDLPPLIKNPVYVTLPPALMKRYRAFERSMYEAEFDIEAVNRGVLTNKLLQFANGHMYPTKDPAAEPDEERDVPKFLHDLKLDALDSIVHEAAGEPVLVAYSYRFDRDVIRKAYPKAVFLDESKTFVRDWNAGRIQMGVTHPASAGHGLNLQFGGSIGVWYGLTWSLELYLQFMKRLHRHGTKGDRVWMHHIIARGTADESVMEVAARKGATQSDITDAVRVRMGRAA